MITLHLAKAHGEVCVDPDQITLIQAALSGGALVQLQTGWTAKVVESVTEINHLIDVDRASKKRQEVLANVAS